MAPIARDLGYYGPPFRWDEMRRAELRGEIEGLYAHLYGLARDDFAYILTTFPVQRKNEVRKNEVRKYSEFRTARLALEAYDALAGRWRVWGRDDRKSDRTAWHSHLGQPPSTCAECLKRIDAGSRIRQELRQELNSQGGLTLADLHIRRYQMTRRTWTHFERAQAAQIATALSNQPLSGPPAGRYGVQSCGITETEEIAMAGVFVHEVPRQRDVLTPNKAVQTTTEPHATPFIFAILPNPGFVSLQARQINVDTTNQVFSDFSDTVISAFRNIGLPFESLDLIETGFTPEEYREAFFSSDTQRVVMVSLSNFSEAPPDDFPYFNPDYQLNQMARRANQFDRREIRSAKVRARPNGDLKHSPTVRGLMRSSSEPQRIEFVTPKGTEILESSRGGRIPLKIAVAAIRVLDALAISILIAATAGQRHQAAPRRRRGAAPTDTSQQSLFDEEK